jgi:hypothetical protein
MQMSKSPEMLQHRRRVCCEGNQYSLTINVQVPLNEDVVIADLVALMTNLGDWVAIVVVSTILTDAKLKI